MRILRDESEIASLADAELRRLIEERVQEINEVCEWDADELGPFIVFEPGDTVQALEAEIGFPVLRNLYDDTPFGKPGFSPAFEYAAAHPEGYYELVYIVSDGGYGYTLYIANRPGVDAALLVMCQTYATANPQPDDRASSAATR